MSERCPECGREPNTACMAAPHFGVPCPNFDTTPKPSTEPVSDEADFEAAAKACENARGMWGEPADRIVGAMIRAARRRLREAEAERDALRERVEALRDELIHTRGPHR